MNIYNLEQFILHLLVKYQELDLRELKIKVLHTEPALSEKMLNLKLNVLKDLGYIVFSEDQSDEYKKCVEEKSKDKRVKNAETYCRKKYPSTIIVKITDNGKIKYVHNCFCDSLRSGDSRETALENMHMCEEYADIKTQPPLACNRVRNTRW